MLSRAHLAAACSAAVVFVTVCALVVLRNATPAQLGAVDAPCFLADLTEQGHGESSSDAPVNGEVFCCAAPLLSPAPDGSLLCEGFGAEGCFGYCMVLGNGPPCFANCAVDCGGGDCGRAAACFLATDMLSDYGKTCFLGGSKRCRCWS
ncbi:hypothetical protein KFE25_004493 [Diacronema lutheri]|uniref:Uncharacterized protein n=1 Tax=Diacronema lutheri TaxID=2081491 RepID=A0A8J5XBI7_DIALT|nr:hypothetical protein KFE25_004493 [Diacronema lutheri]